MKIHGMTVAPPEPVTIPIPRLDSEGREYFIELRLAPVLDYTEFEEMCPPPKVPMKRDPQGVETPDLTPEYKKMVSDRLTLQVDYMVLKSLSATDGLVWDTVDMKDPATWGNFGKEMEEAGFSALEVTQIMNKITSISGMNPKNMEEARKRFLALKQAEKLSEQNSLQEEQ
jgi:hypothetical protein